MDGLDRTFGFAQGAVDALVGIDHQEVGPLVKTVYRTHLDAVGVFAFDAFIGYHKSHPSFSSCHTAGYRFMRLY
jgi:hypothetical protein